MRICNISIAFSTAREFSTPRIGTFSFFSGDMPDYASMCRPPELNGDFFRVTPDI